MRKFEGLGLSAVLAVATAVSGCDRGDDWQASAGPTRVCVDRQGRRVPDSDCAQTAVGHGGVGNAFLWYYLGTLNARRGVPPVGGAVAGGAYAPEAGVSYRAAPAGGIARGGFGGTAESFGGAHGGEGGGHGGGGAGE